MANGRKTIRSFTLYSEDLLNNRGIRCLIILLHLISFLLGITGTVIGVLSFSNGPDNSLPQTSCNLTVRFQQQVEFPLNLLLLLTGVALILTDLATTLLMCVIKWKRCGSLAIVWFLVTTLCTAVWAAFAIFHLNMVFPEWQENKDSCDYLILVAALGLVAYLSFLTVVYLIVILVVIVFDCNRWYHMREVY